jgi:hypothetical protein
MEIKQHLKPHCVNLPIGMVSEIKSKHSVNASKFIRNAICNAMSGNNAYEDGYKAGLSAASETVVNNRWANLVLVDEGLTLANALVEEIKGQDNGK